MIQPQPTKEYWDKQIQICEDSPWYMFINFFGATTRLTEEQFNLIARDPVGFYMRSKLRRS